MTALNGPEELLAAAVISSALDEEGPRWLTWPCGRFWTDILGMDREYAFSMAIKNTRFAGLSYTEEPRCNHPERKACEIATSVRSVTVHYMESQAEFARRSKRAFVGVAAKPKMGPGSHE